jgi:flagellar FliL protein
MAEEEKQKEKPQEDAQPPAAEKKKSFFNQKIIVIGLPLFIVQLVAVYFITANFLLNKVQGSTPGNLIKTEKNDKNAANRNQNVELGKFIYLIEDVIVNPEGTEGKKLLLASIGFDVSSEVQQQELKSKEVLVKDVIVSELSSKTLDQLSNSTYRDTLKTQIGSKVKDLIPDLKLNAVYFSKYIIQ